jgi:hypothetical protein
LINKPNEGSRRSEKTCLVCSLLCCGGSAYPSAFRRIESLALGFIFYQLRRFWLDLLAAEAG